MKKLLIFLALTIACGSTHNDVRAQPKDYFTELYRFCQVPTFSSDRETYCVAKIYDSVGGKCYIINTMGGIIPADCYSANTKGEK